MLKAFVASLHRNLAPDKADKTELRFAPNVNMSHSSNTHNYNDSDHFVYTPSSANFIPYTNGPVLISDDARAADWSTSTMRHQSLENTDHSFLRLSSWSMPINGVDRYPVVPPMCCKAKHSDVSLVFPERFNYGVTLSKYVALSQQDVQSYHIVLTVCSSQFLGVWKAFALYNSNLTTHYRCLH